MEIKAVVFDYGQVITFPQDPKAIGRIAEMAGVERKTFESRLWAMRSGYDRGIITAKEYFKDVLSSFSIAMDDKKIDEMIQVDFDSWKGINYETVALMEELKKAGYPLGILSNMPHDFLA